MQSLAFLKEGFCKVAEDPQDVAAARRPLSAAWFSSDGQRRKANASAETSEKQRLLTLCPPATAAASLISTGGGEAGVLELPDGTRLEADLVATKVRTRGLDCRSVFCFTKTETDTAQQQPAGAAVLRQVECFLQVSEVLFHPQLLSSVPGAPSNAPALADAVRRLAEAVEAEGSRDLLNALVLTGGCSVIPGEMPSFPLSWRVKKRRPVCSASAVKKAKNAFGCV